MKKVRCKKELGAWYYIKLGDEHGELDAPVFDLYDSNKNFVDEFGSYGDMKYYIENGTHL